MSLSAAIHAGKTASSSSSTPQHPPQIQVPFDSSRRVASSSVPTPRNNQAQRKQHKNKRRPKLVDEMEETRALRPGRRGQTSITHLMNFALPPRPQYTRAPRRHFTYHTVDKARYVHANYRFVVRPGGDYHAQAADADIHLDWNDVLQILVSEQSQASSCPICLSKPVATRMAKCGHLFCLPCLIRYMQSTDDEMERKSRWKKCPICYDPIYISEVRPVKWHIGQEQPPPREGEDVVLRLVSRQPGNTLALPRDGGDLSNDVPWYFAAEVADYARVMKGGEEYMQQQFDEEIEELEMQEKEDELIFGEDNLWTQKAINNIKDLKQKTEGIGDAPAMKRQEQAEEREGTPYYFYQALLHHYLAPLDIRILKEAFGSFEQFPTTLLPRVDHVSSGHVVDEELRKKAKYLSHLPYGCEVSFLECDWTDVVPPEILSQFSPDIERRRKRNKEKEVREEKDRIRAEREEEDKRYARRRRSSDFVREDPPLAESLSTNGEPSFSSASPPWPNRQGSTFASLASPGTSPAATTVWGTRVVAPTTPDMAPVDAGEFDDGWLQDWEQELHAENEALVAQVQAASLSEAPAGKKKKGKKITLMSTTARRAA